MALDGAPVEREDWPAPTDCARVESCIITVHV